MEAWTIGSRTVGWSVTAVLGLPPARQGGIPRWWQAHPQYRRCICRGGDVIIAQLKNLVVRIITNLEDWVISVSWHAEYRLLALKVLPRLECGRLVCFWDGKVPQDHAIDSYGTLCKGFQLLDAVVPAKDKGSVIQLVPTLTILTNVLPRRYIADSDTVPVQDSRCGQGCLGWLHADPWVTKHLCCRVAQDGVTHQQVGNQIFAFCWDLAPLLLWELKLALLDVSEELLLACLTGSATLPATVFTTATIEWWITTQHDVPAEKTKATE